MPYTHGYNNSNAWFFLLLGIFCTVFGCLKLYGLLRGITAGPQSSLKDRLLGWDPMWGLGIRIYVLFVFFVAGGMSLFLAAVMRSDH